MLDKKFSRDKYLQPRTSTCCSKTVVAAKQCRNYGLFLFLLDRGQCPVLPCIYQTPSIELCHLKVCYYITLTIPSNSIFQKDIFLNNIKKSAYFSIINIDSKAKT